MINEEKRIKARLEEHAKLMKRFIDDGMDRQEASKKAFEIVTAAPKTPKKILSEAEKDLVSVSIMRDVHGLIKACDPCTFVELRHECYIQTINFEHMTRWDTDCLIDLALNSLIKSGQVIVESCYDSTEKKYDIGFRQA